MDWQGAALWLADGIAHEAMLFAAIGFLIAGLDDLAIDLLWGWRSLRRRLTVYRRHRRLSLLDFAPPRRNFAIFVPAWEEAGVIGGMLTTMLARFGEARVTIFVGCYPNDRATVAAVAEVAVRDERIVVVINPLPGPTTKADNLNAIWRAMRREEARAGAWFDAVVMHDAEDVVHRGELAVFDRLLWSANVIQLPVLPLVDHGSRWIAGHYADEFSECHTKAMVLREALGAALPLAGTGFAIDRVVLGRLAAARNGAPFDADSLTEDYELGMAIGAMGARAIFARVPVAPGGQPVAVRAHFPATLGTAVRQKARWMAGIALAGWDRTGWGGRIGIETWMRMRDRRALLAVAILIAAYLGGAAWLAGAMIRFVAVEPFALPTLPGWLLAATAALAVWRLGVRALVVGRTYGLGEGLRSIPRTLVANLVAVLAARGALLRYIGMLRGRRTTWDKTAHVFPAELPAE